MVRSVDFFRAIFVGFVRVSFCFFEGRIRSPRGLEDIRNSTVMGLRSQEKQALKIVRFQRHLPLTIQFYISCRITGVPPLQSDFSGLSSALKDDTNEPKKRKEARTKPTKMARKKSTLRITTSTLLLHTLRTPTSNAL